MVTSAPAIGANYLKRKMKIKIKCFPEGTGSRLGWFLHGNKDQDIKKTQSLGNNRNPFGTRGKVAHGFRKMTKARRPRTKIEEKIVRDAREIKEMAQLAAPKAVKVIEEIMENERSLDAVRLAAANAILDRAHGKATQTSVTATVNTDGKTSEIDDKELTTRINSALERVERITGGKKQPPKGEERSTDVRKLH